MLTLQMEVFSENYEKFMYKVLSLLIIPILLLFYGQKILKRKQQCFGPLVSMGKKGFDVQLGWVMVAFAPFVFCIYSVLYSAFCKTRMKRGDYETF
jgi:hypothetical protein